MLLTLPRPARRATVPALVGAVLALVVAGVSPAAPAAARPAVRGALGLVVSAASPVDTDLDGVADTVPVTLRLANTGRVDLDGVTVTLAHGGTTTCPATALPAGTAMACAHDEPVTDADRAAGTVVLEATATATGADGDVSASASATADLGSTLTPEPTAIPADPSTDSSTDPSTDAAGDPSDTPDATSSPADPGANDPAAGTTETGTTQTAEPAPEEGSEPSDAEASAAPGSDSPAAPEPSEEPEPAGTPAVPAVSIDTVAGPVADNDADGRASVGDTITLTSEVTDTGTTRLEGLAVTDDDGLPGACATTDLQAGDHTSCVSTYVLTRLDVTAGSVTRVLTARATTPGGEPVGAEDTTTTSTVLPVATGALALVLGGSRDGDTDGDGRVGAGDTTTVTAHVTNIGDLPVTGAVVDAWVFDTPVALACPATTLAPGDDTTCTATHVLTQRDLDSGFVAERGTARATGPDGADVVSPVSVYSLWLDARGDLDLTVTAHRVDVDHDGVLGAGDRVDYAFDVANTGPIRVVDVAVATTGPETDAAGPEATCAAYGLLVTESTTCTASHVITAADVAAGEVELGGQASAMASSAEEYVVSPERRLVTRLALVPSLSLAKSAGDPVDVDRDGRTGAGDRVDYTFLLTNTGDVDLTDVGVTDPLVAVTCPGTTLTVGATLTCAAPYLLTQADVDRGELVNTATAHGRPPAGAAVTSDPSRARTALAATTGIALDKSAGGLVDTDGNGRGGSGDQVPYTFVVTNTGTATLDDVRVDDPTLAAAGAAVTCPVATLPPGTATSCHGVHVVDRLDVVVGAVVNTATATGVHAGTVRSLPDSTTTPLLAPGALTLAKAGEAPYDANGSGRTDAGDTIVYDFTVSNTGGQPLDRITLTDPLVATVSCPRTALPPGATTVCRGVHTITGAEVDRGSVVNTATAGGTTPAGTTLTSAPSTVTVPLAATPALGLLKTAALRDNDGDDTGDAGERVDYTFTVTNTGTVGLGGVSVVDQLLADRGQPVRCPDGALAPGRSTTCVAHLVVRKGDTDGPLRNVATARAAMVVDGHAAAGEVVSLAASATVPMGRTQLLPAVAVKAPPAAAASAPKVYSGPLAGLLPDTGGPSLVIAPAGALLVLLGAGLLLADRRRRRPAG